jgi:predicted transcriptional regulator
MSGRRSRFEIYIDVLIEIMNGSKKPTKIMYGANLSYKPLKEILQSLLEQSLIEEEEGRIRDKRTKVKYTLTQKGVNVIRYYSKAKDLVEISNPKDLDYKSRFP